jgi:hypothetical protein
MKKFPPIPAYAVGGAPAGRSCRGGLFPIGSVPNVGRERHQPAGEQRSKYDAAPEGCSEHADRDVREFFVASADSQRRTLQSVPRLHEADKLAIVARRSNMTLKFSAQA